MTAPPTLQQQALAAAHDAIRDGRWWLPPAGQAEVVDAVLAVIQPRIDRILKDADHHDACVPIAETPEGGIAHSGMAEGLRLAARYLNQSANSSARRAVAFQTRIDAARAWARQHLEPEQQAGLLAALRGDDTNARCRRCHCPAGSPQCEHCNCCDVPSQPKGTPDA